MHAQSCAAVDTVLALPLKDMKVFVASTRPSDVSLRQTLSIPTVDSAQVTAVTDLKICDKVLAAVKPTLPPDVPVPTRLFVMKVGTIYVALYPETQSETDFYRALSRQYAVLSRWAK